MKIGKKFFIIFSSPCLRRIEASNFASGWVENRARRETRDSRAQNRNAYSRGFSISHSEYSTIPFNFRPHSFLPLHTKKQQRNRETTIAVLMSQPYYPQSSVLRGQWTCVHAFRLIMSGLNTSRC